MAKSVPISPPAMLDNMPIDPGSPTDTLNVFTGTVGSEGAPAWFTANATADTPVYVNLPVGGHAFDLYAIVDDTSDTPTLTYYDSNGIDVAVSHNQAVVVGITTDFTSPVTLIAEASPDLNHETYTGEQNFPANPTDLSNAGSADFITVDYGHVWLTGLILPVVVTGLSSHLVGNIGDNYFRGGDGNDTLEGADAFDVHHPSSGHDYLFGGGGNDWLLANSSGGGHLWGESGNDTISGGAGADYMSGGAGNDVIYMSNGADTVRGGLGSDTITFQYNLGSAVTVDLAKASNDRGMAAGKAYSSIENVIGSDGADHLAGDTHQNKLWGEAGKDVFYFTSTSISGTGTSTRDSIMDFAHGSDKIDLSKIDADGSMHSGNGKFLWDGTAHAFSNHTHGEVRIIKQAHAGDYVVSIDTDKDTSAEMTIFVHSAHGLSSGDFIL